MREFLIFTLFSAVMLSVSSTVFAAAQKPDGYIKEWTILGPFPNPERKADSSDRGAFDIDYLKPIGGEAKAQIRPETAVNTGSGNIQAKSVKLSDVVLDFANYYSDTDYKLAYAYTELESSSDEEVFFFFGSDDGAKVWLNGKLIFETLPPGGRALVQRQDRFKGRLKQGVNTILVKVENGLGGWQLALEAYTGEQARAVEEQIQKEANAQEFLRQELTLANAWPGYIYSPFWGITPRIIWRDADRVRELVGDIPLKVRWFDANLNEVKQPKEAGRYAAYIEGKLKNGTPLRRSMTFCCVGPEFSTWDDWGLDVPYLGKPIDKQVWDEHKDFIKQHSGTLYRNALWSSESGAILLAGLCEAKPSGNKCSVTDSPEVLHDDHHLKLKLKLLGVADKTKELAQPRLRTGALAPVIRTGTPAEAGMRPDAKEKIDAVCRQWAEDSGEPFTILVARHGVIVTHEAFGKTPDGTPIGLDYRKDVMSITKAVSGMLFSLFLDQGYTKLDDPIGRWVPGFPTEGERALTYRHLFTHTCGLAGHGEWGGIHNPHLENVVLNGLDSIHLARLHVYNGMGYDLAGKAMEYMTGKSIIRLFHDNLFRPLGIQDVPLADLAYGARLTSYELGILGQWLANRGSYGDKQFISEETFKKLLPEQLSKYYPGINVEWGIGLTWFKEQKPGTPAGSKDPKDLIFGEHVIGHGSASACILRVDLDHDLVIAQVRKTAGEKYGEYCEKFFMAIAESML